MHLESITHWLLRPQRVILLLCAKPPQAKNEMLYLFIFMHLHVETQRTKRIYDVIQHVNDPCF